MKSILEEYGGFIIAFIVGLVLIGVLVFYSIDSTGLADSIPTPENGSPGTNQVYYDTKPTLEVKEKFYFKTRNETLTDSMFYTAVTKAVNYKNEDIKNKVKIKDIEKLDGSKAGANVITFKLTDNGVTISKKAIAVFNQKLQDE